MQEHNLSEQNPLRKYFRQPKLYIELPSKGKWYPQNALKMTETGELPVYAMTAKDELMMKTPDALLNGQATVDLIKSCVPNIIDPWQMPSIDLDVVLIGIRIATYGETLDMSVKIPNTNEDREFTVDLRNILNRIGSIEFSNELEINNMLLKLKPLSYLEFTENSMKTFEEQRIFRTVSNNNSSDSEKIKIFNDSFRKLTNLTVGMLSQSIESIVVDDQIVSNRSFIKEFVDNADKDVFRTVLDHLESQKKKFSIGPLKVQTTFEDQQKGAPAEFDLPITFDQSNFFA